MTKRKRKAAPTAQSVDVKLNQLIAILDAWTQPKGIGAGDDATIQAQSRQVNDLIKKLRNDGGADLL